MIGKRRPLIGVFSLTNYCNYYCPMCPFGDLDKEAQIKFAQKNDLTTQQWKKIFEKVWSTPASAHLRPMMKNNKYHSKQSMIT